MNFMNSSNQPIRKLVEKATLGDPLALNLVGSTLGSGVSPIIRRAMRHPENNTPLYQKLRAAANQVSSFEQDGEPASPYVAAEQLGGRLSSSVVLNIRARGSRPLPCLETVRS